MSYKATVVICAVLAAAGAASAAPPTPHQKCEQNKLKAIGKRQQCFAKQRANVVVGKPDESAECEVKFAAAIAKANIKATEAGTVCRYLANGDDTVTDLDTPATCGNDIAEAGESCDGADLDGATCATAAPATAYGVLACNATCTLDTSGCTVRFVDNGDGTVSDQSTGLMWEKKDDLGGLHDNDNAYSWSTTNDDKQNGTVFTAFISQLNKAGSTNGMTSSGCFAGHCDWRLPLIEELVGIAGQPGCVDPVFGPAPGSIASGGQLSLSTADETDSAWVFDRDNCLAVKDKDVGVDKSSEVFSARGVRGAQ